MLLIGKQSISMGIYIYYIYRLKQNVSLLQPQFACCLIVHFAMNCWLMLVVSTQNKPESLLSVGTIHIRLLTHDVREQIMEASYMQMISGTNRDGLLLALHGLAILRGAVDVTFMAITMVIFTPRSWDLRPL